MGSPAKTVVNISNSGSHLSFVYYIMTILVEIIPSLDPQTNGNTIATIFISNSPLQPLTQAQDNPKANTEDRIVMLWALGSSMGMS